MNGVKTICAVCCFQLRLSKTERLQMFHVVKQQLKIDEKIRCTSCKGRFLIKTNGALSCKSQGVEV